MVKRLSRLVFAFIAFLFIAFSAGAAETSGVNTPILNKSEISSKMRKIRIPFISNEGQADKRVKFYANTFGGTVLVTKHGELVYSLPKAGPRGLSLFTDGAERSRRIGTVPGTTLTEKLVGGKVKEVHGEEKATTNVSVFKGNDRSKWKKHIDTYNLVDLGEAYKGIDVKVNSYGESVEKLFYVKAGADPKKIRLKLNGATSLKVNKEGELVVRTALGDMKFSKPIAYQETEDRRQKAEDRQQITEGTVPDLRTSQGGVVESGLSPALNDRKYVDVAYVVKGRQYGFSVGDYDRTKELVIDPILQSTFLGGSGTDSASGIAIGPDGSIYVAGTTGSVDFPYVFPYVFEGVQTSNAGGSDIFVAKLDSDLTSILQSTYLGGSSGDAGSSIAIDSNGNVYVTGYTYSTNFPGTAGGAQLSNGGGASDAFASKLNSGLTSLVQSTYLGGSGMEDYYGAITIGAGGAIYVTGYTDSTNFPRTAGGAKPSSTGGAKAFVTRLNSALTSILQSTYLGGDYGDAGSSIAVDSNGNVYVTGYTYSTNFPGVSGGAQHSIGGNQDSFVSKLNSSLTSILQSTYLGGSGNDFGGSIFIDSGGNIYVAGYTESTNFPGTSGGAQSSSGGYRDGFVSKLNSALTSILQTTYFGGWGNDTISSVAVDSGGNIYAAGYTDSPFLPGTAGGAQPSPCTGTDAFASKFSNLSNDGIPPTITSLTPSDGFIGLSVNSVITATFSEAMDASTINTTNFKLNNGTVPGTVSYNSGTKKATFTPSGNLAYDTVYTATVTTGVKDLAGNMMMESKEWSFATEVQKFSLSVSKSGTGTGTVIADGINCGSDCAETYDIDTLVTLAALEDESSTFTGWSGGGCSGAGECVITMNADTAVSAGFDLNTYNIFTGAGDNGSISPESATVHYNESKTFTISPSTGYHVEDVIVDDESIGPVTSHTFSNIKSDHTLYATFAINTYTITPGANAGGSIACADTTVNWGGSTICTASPATGYHVSSVTVDGNPASLTDNTYTFGNVTANHSISIIFAIDTFNITIIAGVNGTVTCTRTTVNYNDGSSCAITPHDGYVISNVTVDTIPRGVLTTYDFEGVTSAHTIEAVFDDIPAADGFESNGLASLPWRVDDPSAWAVQADTKHNGDHAVELAMASVTDNASSLKITLDVQAAGKVGFWYKVSSAQNHNYLVFKIDGVEQNNWSGDVNWAYASFPVGTGIHTFSWEYATDGFNDRSGEFAWIDNIALPAYNLITFNITASSGANGGISPAGVSVVNYGFDKTYDITPSVGYHVSNVTVDDVSQGAVSGYTFTNVTANHTIAAAFAINTYAVTSISGSGGTISCTPSVVEYDSDSACVMKPDTGYHVTDVKVDGFSIGTPDNFGFTNVKAPHTIEVTYAINTYQISASAGPHGSVICTPAIVEHGSSSACAITPDAGYRISGVSVDTVAIGTPATYNFENVTSLHNIEAAFSDLPATDGFETNDFTALPWRMDNPAAWPNIWRIQGMTKHGGDYAAELSLANGTDSDSALKIILDIQAAGKIGFWYKVSSAQDHNYLVFKIDGVEQKSWSGDVDWTYVSFPIEIGVHTFSWDRSMDGFNDGSGEFAWIDNVAFPAYNLITFNVTASPGANGVISPSGVTAVDYGFDKTYTITPNVGYHVSNVLIDDVSKGAVSTYTFTDVTSDHSIAASFDINTYTVTFSAGGNGKISCLPATVNYGASTVCTIEPDPTYLIDNVTINGNSVGAVTSPYTINNITTDTAVGVTFVFDTHTTYSITAISGPHGSISPGTSSVVYNNSQTFKITPDEGYHIASLTVDGSPVDIADSYTFDNVKINHSIAAVFAINTFTVTPSAGPNGRISPDTPQAADYGSTPSFAITPDAGYHIESVTGCGGSLSGDTFTTGQIKADCGVAASFAINVYSITATAGANGSISPSTSSVNYNGSQAISITPNAGYHVEDVLVDGTSVGAVSGYTFDKVSSNHTIWAAFAINVYTVTVTAGKGGSVSCSPMTVNHGSSSTCSVTPDTGYSIASVEGCGGQLSGNTYATAPITADCKVAAFFVLNTYKVSVSAGPDGVISPDTAQTAGYGSTAVFTVTPSAGCHIVSVTGCGGSLSGSTYTTGKITGDCAVAATFAANPPDTFTVTPLPVINGSVSPNTTQFIIKDSAMSFTITANTGWHIDSVAGCGGTLAGNIFTTGPITADCVVAAKFAVNSYTITATAGENGSITPASATINYGDDRTFIITPNNGFMITDVLVDGVSVGPVMTYTVNNVQGPHTIEAQFGVASQYLLTVTVNKPAGGTITTDPEGIDCGDTCSHIFTQGTTVNFKVATNDGFIFLGWQGTCDVVTSTKLNCNAVTMDSDKTVKAYFTDKIVTLTVVKPEGGTIKSFTSLSQDIFCGSSGDKCSKIYPSGIKQTISTTPDAGYTFTGWSGGGCKGTGLCTISLDSSKTVSAKFAKKTFTIKKIVEGEGSISPAGVVTVEYGTNKTFTMTPKSGNYLAELRIDKNVISKKPLTYEMKNITRDRTLTAKFLPIPYDLTVVNVFDGEAYSMSEGPGTITSIDTHINCGDTCEATYDSGTKVTLSSASGSWTDLAGWQVVNLKDNTSTSECKGKGKCIVKMNADKKVSARYAKKKFTIKASVSGHGKIVPSGNVVVEYGDWQDFDFYPDKGYGMDDLLIDGESLGYYYRYVFDYVDAPHTIKVVFKKQTDEEKSQQKKANKKKKVRRK